jgi:hypothetical protein
LDANAQILSVRFNYTGFAINVFMTIFQKDFTMKKSIENLSNLKTHADNVIELGAASIETRGLQRASEGKWGNQGDKQDGWLIEISEE